MSLRRPLLLVLCVLAACDLSDLTDGREGGGGAGATGAGGAGSTGGTGAVGGTGAAGGGCTPAPTPFEWLVSIGNDAPQATSAGDAGESVLSSVRVASDPTNNAEFVVAMVTGGGALFPSQPEPATELSLVIARFDASGNLVSQHTHPQAPFVSGEPTKLVLDDLVVHTDGTVVLAGRRGGGSVRFDSPGDVFTTLDTSQATDVFIATFNEAGLALDVSHLQSADPTLSMGAHSLLSLGEELFITGMAPDGLTGVACTPINTIVNKKHGNLYAVALQSGVGLGTCTRGRRFSASNGTGLTITSLVQAADKLAMSVQFNLLSPKKIEFGSDWTLTATAAAEYTNDSLIVGFDVSSLDLEWATLVQTPGSGRDDVSKLVHSGSDLWAAGSSTGGATQDLVVKRLFPNGGNSPCTADHTTTFVRATVMTLNAFGNCTSATSLGPQSDADHAVSNGAPIILGEGNQESFATELDETFSQNIVNNGFLLQPLSVDQSLTVSGFMFGGGNTLRVDDAAIFNGQVLVVGSMAEPFLNLLECGEDPVLDYDFYVGMVDSSFTPAPP